MHWLANYSLFLAKTFTFVIAALLLVVGIVIVLSKNKEKKKGHFEFQKLNDKYSEQRHALLSTMYTRAEFKKYIKQEKQTAKEKEKELEPDKRKRIFIIDFEGDIKASAVTALREEITAVLQVANSHDQVVVCLESPGGMVPNYGLAASQLQRLRQHQIPLTVIVDKVAASGGYLMACVADRILAAPFAFIGSIGVVAQIPNFNRLLKKNDIDFEQISAGEYKRTLTLFGENTEAGRQKFREELEEVHHHFKAFIQQNRPQVDLEQVATGEHWLALTALNLRLIDGISTTDDYLLAASKDADLYQVTYSVKKPLTEKFLRAIHMLIDQTIVHLRNK